jgi:hypothetical protein
MDDNVGTAPTRITTSHILMWLVAVAQVLTVWITWPLWHQRTFPPALPRWEWAEWPLPWGWLMIASALLAALYPRVGVWLHGGIYLAACVDDQMRTQPQVAALWILLIALLHVDLRFVGRWFLISMWLWAGIHKLSSAEWLGPTSYQLLQRSPLDPDLFHDLFAFGAAWGEIALAALALLKPRWAAGGCVALHLGIIVFLSPWGINWNFSVIPWNVATAVVGGWLLASPHDVFPHKLIPRIVTASLLLYPIGFYWGWVDHGIGFVLYSENIAKGLVTSTDGVREIVGWGELNVPFPNERRLLRQHFERTAKPGDKLHIFDPRATLDDQWFVATSSGSSLEISEAEFRAGPLSRNDQALHSAAPEVFVLSGRYFDDPLVTWQLRRAHVRLLKKSADDGVYAAAITPDQYRADLIGLVAKLKNLEQLQLSGTAVTDRELAPLTRHPSLQGIGLTGTGVTDASLEILTTIPNLKHIDFEQTGLTKEKVWEFLDRDAIQKLKR